ncbi:MAG: membrane protein insertase YidC [bacterium]|nr:membrane protein insertase YidC [bacterium]
MDRRTVTAFVLIGLIIVLMPYYMRWIQGEPIRPFEPVEFESPPIEQPGSYSRTPTPSSEIAERPDPSSSLPSLSAPTPSAKLDSLSFVPQDVIVDTDVFQAVFSTQGGRIVSWKLKTYLDSSGDWLELIGPSSAGLGVSLLDQSLDHLEFIPNTNRLELQGTRQDELVFTGTTSWGTVHKRFRFQGDRYRLEMTISTVGLPRNEKLGLKWDGGLANTEDAWNSESGLYQVEYDQVVTYAGGEVENWTMERINGEEKPPSGQLTWVGVRNKYFLVGMIPLEGRYDVSLSGEARSTGYQEFHVKLQADASVDQLHFSVFVGPISYDNLRLQNEDLNGTYREINLDEFIDYGWAFFRPVNKPVTIMILKSFLALHKLVPNFGVVIVLFSIFVKIFVFPLTHKSLESAAKMQQLQPQIQELKEKHGDNKEKLNTATMKLYKDQKINPLGGCLPMMLQMPILISLFTLFRATIELRHAHFGLWIEDLSKPDTLLIGGFDLHVLPILMGASMFFQQKMTMKDPKQAALVYIMPIFLTYIFWTMSSGLVFYYTLYNLLTLAQQTIMEKTKIFVGTD